MMCEDQLLRLKEGIRQRKENNLYFSKTDTTKALPQVEMSLVYASMAQEDSDILMMFGIVEESG
jgi:hypothetical protein